MISENIKLHTWVDAQECFIYSKSSVDNPWPANVFAVKCYWDNVTVYIYKDDKLDEIIAWLNNIFEPRFKNDTGKLTLLFSDDVTVCTILIEVVDADESTSFLPNIRPSLETETIIYNRYKDIQIEKLNSQIRSIAFHSFKGGVGRTVHALALAKSLSNKEKKVLLIDGDFEAPGISYLINNWTNVDVSYSDLLALIHSDSSEGFEKTINFAASKIVNQKIDNIFLLPSFRSQFQQKHFEIKPDNITKFIGDGFTLPKIINSIGAKLQVDYIIIDLRAGLSELSTGILLDPRIEKILATSLSSQSIEGTKLTLDLIKQFASQLNLSLPEISIILNYIPEIYLKDRESLDLLKNELSNRFLGDLNEQSDEIDIKDINFFESNFVSELLVLTNDFKDVFDKIEKSGIMNRFENFYVQEQPEQINLEQSRETLRAKSYKMIFAEQGEVNDILWTSPLKRLAESHKDKIPAIVINGPKGAGKTLIFNQLLMAKTWKDFLNKGNYQSSSDAVLFPVIKPISISGKATETFKESQKNVCDYLGLANNLEGLDVRDYIDANLKNDIQDSEWRTIWLNCIAKAAGFISSSDNIGIEFIEYLKSNNKKVIAVFDGIEDFFQEIHVDDKQKKSLRSLLQRLPDWLEQQPGTPLGIIILVRQDYVEYSIVQNSAQFLAKYERFQLKWNVEEVLKLILYVTASVLPAKDIELNNIDSYKKEKIIEFLVPLWGTKLGSDSSNEAYSANWILTALSDWKGQIQARDIIRFLFKASEKSIGVQSNKADRILLVGAIKDAVQFCSKEKVDEVAKENNLLNELFVKIGQFVDKKTPFLSSEMADLSPVDIKLLIDNGVLFREITKAKEEQFHIAEIYREGLNFIYKGRKMTKMLAFRRAIES